MRLTILAITLLSSLQAVAQLRPVEAHVGVSLVDAEGQVIRGDVTGFDREVMEVRRDGQTDRVPWASLPAADVFATYQRLMTKSDGRQWLELAQLLITRPGGAAMADSALQVAGMLDPQLADEVELVRAQRPEETAAAAPMVTMRPPEPEIEHAAAEVVWGDVSPESFQRFVDEDKAFAQRVADELKVPLNLVETDYFLFYTDLPPREAYEWQRVLDLMYERVSFLLNIPKGVNVFRGKALVFLFAEKEQFVQFERRFYDRTVTYEAGLCHQHGTGEVRITFYKLEDEKYLKQLMVHEAAHGVVHRYRSPVRVVDWINEGIAEWTADAVLDYPQPFKWKKQLSGDYVRKNRGLDAAYFAEGQFKPEYYGTALSMVEILLRGGRPRFNQFIDQLKDGVAWPAALRQVYELTPEELATEYLKTVNVRVRQ